MHDITSHDREFVDFIPDPGRIKVGRNNRQSKLQSKFYRKLIMNLQQ